MNQRATTLLVMLLLATTTGLVGCDNNSSQPSGQTPSVLDYSRTPDKHAEKRQAPPSAPLLEDFEGKPQLSLFARVGDYRPENDDELFPFWNTYMEHLGKISGLVKRQDDSGDNHAWGFRGIKSIDSVAYFAPVAVEPNTDYTISFQLWSNLAEGAETGLGILEFDQFLWIGEQYTQQQVNESLTHVIPGLRLTGKHEAETQTLKVTTGPDTRMIHLVFFREGSHDRNLVIIDNIQVNQ